jgi:hypothetical protein
VLATAPPPHDRRAHRAAVAIADAEFARAQIDLEDAWDSSDLDALEQKIRQLLRAKIAHTTMSS